MNFRNLLVLDFEADSPKSSTSNIVEIGALVINPRTLQIIQGSEFFTYVRPPTIDDTNYVEEHRETISFHALARNCSSEDVLKLWSQAPSQKVAWHNFVNYTKRYHTVQSRQSIYTAPLLCGYGIWRFDIPIINRMSEQYGQLSKDGDCTLFFPRDVVDVMPIMWYWTESSKDINSLSLDYIRDYMSISKEGAHSALKDVQDTAQLLIRFLNLSRKYASKVKFKDAFQEIENE